MIVTCETCQTLYDDTYHWTYCPHEFFEMQCRVLSHDGQDRMFDNVDDLVAYLNSISE